LVINIRRWPRCFGRSGPWFSVWQTRRQKSIQPWLARVLVAMTFAGWVALISGWYTTEIGRQPWLVQGVLTAAQAASNVPASNIALTLVMYLTLYVTLLFSYIKVVFYLAKKATLKDGGVHTGGVADAEPAVQGAQHA
jgi:cytochrome d ubiquinol oxidase subunit I